MFLGITQKIKQKIKQKICDHNFEENETQITFILFGNEYHHKQFQCEKCDKIISYTRWLRDCWTEEERRNKDIEELSADGYTSREMVEGRDRIAWKPRNNWN